MEKKYVDNEGEMEGRMLGGGQRKKGLAIVLAQPEKFR